MYIKNGVAYAEEAKPEIKVWGVRAMSDYRLWLRFSTGEAKVFDFKPLIDTPAFSPLSDMAVFKDVYIDYGIPVWMDGDIDIAPEYLYEHAEPQGAVSA